MVPEVGVLAWTPAESRPLVSFLVAERWLAALPGPGPHHRV